MTSLFSYLHNSLKVTPPTDITAMVILPSELLNDYVGLLDSLSGFVNAICRRQPLFMQS